jgi:ASC-1-like (ASCH) protein
MLDMKQIKKKVKQKYFKDVIDGKKRFEVRLADFDCALGDTLTLQEQNPKDNTLTGNEIDCEVLYKFNTKEIEKCYSKEDMEKYGLAILAIRRKYKHKNSTEKGQK